jgi:hemoglobin-like flavoprotein
MTPEHRELVHATWALAAPAADDIARRFYARLFEIDADAARLFTATDMAVQRRKFTDMLASIVRAIDEPDHLVPDAGALGRRHVTYSVEEHHFDSVGEALLWALARTLGEAYTPAVLAAWSEAYALVAAVMRRAGGHARARVAAGP